MTRCEKVHSRGFSWLRRKLQGEGPPMNLFGNAQLLQAPRVTGLVLLLPAGMAGLAPRVAPRASRCRLHTGRGVAARRRCFPGSRPRAEVVGHGRPRLSCLWLRGRRERVSVNYQDEVWWWWCVCGHLWFSSYIILANDQPPLDKELHTTGLFLG